jgi:small subunit ribosomal protein S5
MAEKSEKKKEFEKVKKTVEAHGTLSEEESEEQAKDAKKVTEKIIEKDFDKKTVEEEREKEALEKAEAAEEKEKEEKIKKIRDEHGETLSSWEPKTKLGQEVKDGKIKDLDEIIDSNRKILEEQIVDFLLNVQTDLISIGQSKGKFGGGKRRAWRQTQKKTKEGNTPAFSSMAVVGDENGHIGIGVGKSQETLPARDKALRKAKINIIKIKRGCASFDCACDEKHTVPFKVTGKSGSVTVTLIPAPQGTGLVAAKELKKMLKFAGIKDVYSKTFGSKRTTFNLIKAGFDALNKTNR